MSYSNIAVILASYNGAKYIKDQILSVLHQQDVQADIFIYDDCSSDGTTKVIDELIEGHQGIFLVKRPKGSGSAFRNFNLAIQEFDPSFYRYFAFCDQDDIWRPEKLKLQIEAIEAESLAGCSSSVDAFYTDGKVTYINNAGRQTDLDFAFQGGGQGCTYVMSAAYFLALQSFIRKINEPDIPHDWLAYALARSRGLKWKIFSEPLILYRQHDNVFGARTGFAGLMSRYAMLKSRQFKNGRLVLSDLLASEVPDSVPLQKLKAATTFTERLAFALRHREAFRRSPGHARLMALMFAAGYA